MALDLKPRKRIGLVAHDNKKQDLIEWARFNRGMLAAHDLVATGTTGTMLGRELELPVTCLQSGPLGGDLQIGAMIADGSIDFLVFFWDPLEPQPHDTTSSRCCGSRSCGTSPSPVTAPRPTS